MKASPLQFIDFKSMSSVAVGFVGFVISVYMT